MASRPKPDASKIKTDTSKPNPAASKPEPGASKTTGASKPKPGAKVQKSASNAKANTSKMEQDASTVKTPTSKAKGSKGKSDAPKTKPAAIKPDASKPSASKPKPAAAKTKTGAPKPKPGTSKVKADESKLEQDASTLENPALKNESNATKVETATSEQEGSKTIASKSKPAAAKPKTAGSKPKTAGSKPKTAGSKPKPAPSKPKTDAPSTQNKVKTLPPKRPPKAQKMGTPKAGGRKPVKGKAPVPRDTATEAPTQSSSFADSAIVNKQEGTQAEPTGSKLSRNDTLVIATLWSLEIINTLTESLKSSFLLQDTESRAAKINFILSIQATRWVLLVLTLISIGGVAWLTDGKKKFLFLFAGLSIYLITPVVGLLATNVNIVGLIDLMLLVQFGWTSVSALRYWFILHQKFPLSVVQTRSIVTYNELFVDLTEYLTVVCVSLRTFDSIVYSVVWTIMLVLLSLWLGMVWIVKSYINNLEDDMEVDQNVYRKSGLLDSFNARQTFQHRVIVLCLIFPSMMMSLQKGSVAYIFRQLRNDLPLFAKYRIDLVITLWCLPIVTGMLIKWFAVRQEMRDLFVIGISHFLNVLICAFLLMIISSSSQASRVAPDGSTAPVTIPRDAVIAFIVHPELEHEGLTVTHENEAIGYKGYTLESMSAIIAPAGSTARVTGKLPNGTLVFDTKIIAAGNVGYYLKDKNLTEIKGFGSFFKPLPKPDPKIVLLLISGLTKCEAGPEYDFKGTRCIFQGSCRSVRISFVIYGTDILPNNEWEWGSNVPHLGGTIGNVNITFPADGSISFLFTYHVDGVSQFRQERVSLTKRVHEHSPYVIISTRLEGTNRVQNVKSQVILLPRYAVADEGKPKNATVAESSWHSEHGTAITSVLSASSISIGVASASYIHFMWIQCPVKHRVPILAFFFGVNFLGSWLSVLLLSGLKMTPFFILLSCQVLGGVWHLCSSIVFRRKLRTLSDDEQNNIKNMQF